MLPHRASYWMAQCRHAGCRAAGGWHPPRASSPLAHGLLGAVGVGRRPPEQRPLLLWRAPFENREDVDPLVARWNLHAGRRDDRFAGRLSRILGRLLIALSAGGAQQTGCVRYVAWIRRHSPSASPAGSTIGDRATTERATTVKVLDFGLGKALDPSPDRIRPAVRFTDRFDTGAYESGCHPGHRRVHEP